MKTKIFFGIFFLISFVGFSQAPGDNCASAVSLTLPTSEGGSITTGLQSTATLINDYPVNSYFNTSYGGGNDGVYLISVPSDDYTYKFEYLNSGMAWKVLSIHTGCIPTTGNCVGGLTTSSGTDGNVTLTLDAGVYYLFVDTWPEPYFGNFEIKITLVDFPTTGEVCSLAQGFCSDVEYNFANTITSLNVSRTPPVGVDYSMGSGCIGNNRALVWYYMEIDTSGPMEMTLAQSTLPNGAGSGIDVDFVMWGPYASFSAACTGILSGDNPLQGSYDPAATEKIALGASGGDGDCASSPLIPSVGEIYVVGISNYGNQAGYITFSKTAGTGTASCNTITPCDISSVTASPSACSNGVFNITGSVSFTNAPSTGSITISSSSFGGSVTYTAPFTSPLSYTISNVSGAGSGSVSVKFSDDAFCTAASSTFTAPTCVSCTNVSISSQSTASQTKCIGSAFTAISVTASGTNPTYQWYSNTTASTTGGTLIPTAQSTSYTPSSALEGTTYYYCIVTGDCGSPVTSGVSGEFIVEPTSVGGTVGSDQSICLGSSPTAINLTGNTGSVTNWEKASNITFTGATSIASTSTTLSAVTIGAITSTTYFRAVVKSGLCSSTNSSFITITVDPTSVAGSLSVDQSICSGSTPSTISLTGNVGNVVKWQSATNTLFTGAVDIANTSLTLTGASIGALTTTTYFRAVVKSGSCDEVYSNYLTVSISTNITPSVTISSSDLDNIVCENSSVTFTPSPINGGSNPTYQWYVNGILKGSSNSYTSILNNQDEVSCKLHSNSGCLASNDVLSNTIKTSVNPLPTITSMVSNTTICAGNTFNVNGTTSNGTSYWTTLGSGTFNNANSLSAVYTPSSTDINAGVVGLYLHADGIGGCLGQNVSQRVDLTFNTFNSPVVSLGNDTTICAVNKYNANGIASNGTILWTSSGTGTFNNNSISNPIYTPSVADTTSGNIKLKLVVIGTIGVCNGFSKSDSLIVSFNKVDAPKIDAGSNATVCAVSSYTTSGIKNLGIAQWTTSGTGSFTNGTSVNSIYSPSNADITAGSVKLYLTVTGTANQCLGQSTKDSLVLIFDKISVPTSNAGVNSSICAPSDYTAVATATNANSIKWTTNGSGTFQNDAIEDVVYVPSASDITNGQVTLTMLVNGGGNCITAHPTSSIVLTINKTPTASITGSSSICIGSNAPVVFTGTPNAVVAYNLNGGATQNIILSSTGSASFMSTNVNADQIYNLLNVTASNTGCKLTTSSSININVVVYPTSPAVSNDSTYCEQYNLELLKAQAKGGGVLKWYSDLALTDSIGTGVSFNPNHFTSSYYVTETNLIGCESTPSIINVTVNKCEIKVPTAFTPDGDGVNDTWELEDLDLIYPNNSVKIYNRWGNIVFESTPGSYQKHPWDGKIKQDDLPVASYYYIIEYNDAKSDSVKGIVTIIRK